MSFFDVQRVLFEEELGKFTHFFRHLEAHDFAIAFNFSDRVARAQTSQRSIINVEGAHLLAQVAQIPIGSFCVEVFLLEAHLFGKIFHTSDLIKSVALHAALC